MSRKKACTRDVSCFKNKGIIVLMKTRIVIVGMGEIGAALASTLTSSHHSVQCWDKMPGRVKNQKTLFEIVPTADFLFLCVPSWCISNVLKSVKPFIHLKTVVVGISKGLQQGTAETTYEYLTRELLSKQPIVYMGGAMLAEELMANKAGFAAVVSTKRDARDAVIQLFHNTVIHVVPSGDIRGVSLASVFKNVYALGLGITQGLSWGGNERAWFAYEALLEMERLIPHLGGKKQSVYSPAGVIDLIATGFSALSKNVEVGNALIKKKKGIPQSEGLVSLEPARQLLKNDISLFPILKAIVKVASQKDDAKLIFKQLLPRK